MTVAGGGSEVASQQGKNVVHGAGKSLSNASSGMAAAKEPIAKPPKSFLPSTTRATTAINDGLSYNKTSSNGGMLSGHRSSLASRDHSAAANGSHQPDEHSLAGSEPSSIPTARNRPRRESIGQTRRKATDSAAAAASGGGYSYSFSNRSQPIPSSRSASRGFSTSPRPEALGSSVGTPSFSTSLGSAAEALSLPASVLNSGAKTGRSTGHTHFGQECFGPEPGESIPNPPASLTKNAIGSTPASVPNASNGPSVLRPLASGSERRGSLSESVNGDDDSSMSANGRTANGKELPIHKCESCNKIYRHPSCLIKHRWEHTVYWKEASKFLMSKHQQVQLLEAAAILVNLDGDTASLPDEKALWPAAVSPASSGLLGSERVNFDKMMQRKAAMRGPRRPSDASTIMSPSTSIHDLSERGASPSTSGLARSASAGLSPLNSFTKLGLNGTPLQRPTVGSGSYSFNSVPYSYGSRVTSDIQHLALDESDERSSRPEDDDDDDEEEGEGRSSGRDTSISPDSPDDYEDSPEGKNGDQKWGLHEDAVADMDMDE